MPEEIIIHTCCAPCLTHSFAVLTNQDNWENSLEIKPDFIPIIFYFNPNIYPLEEEIKRYEEVKKLYNIYKNNNINCFLLNSEINFRNKEEWSYFIKGLENEPEKGKRCELCFEFRLKKTFEIAKEKGIPNLVTTLTLSPHKNSEIINNIGSKLSEIYNINYIRSNFKKNNGYIKSINYCKIYDIYRQNYCGCIFSKK